MASRTSSPTETTGLLAARELGHRFENQTVLSSKPPSDVVGDHSRDASPFKILPLALLAALAMGATAATTIFAYASLLCKDPARCRKSEQNVYAGAVAAATCAANICGLLLLGTLERLSKKNDRAGLALWFSLRSMSVVMLLIGCRHSRTPFFVSRPCVR